MTPTRASETEDAMASATTTTTSNGKPVTESARIATEHRPRPPKRAPRTRPVAAAKPTASPAAIAAALADDAGTAQGTDARNVDGKAIAITVFSTVKWPGRFWLPAVFFVGSRVKTPIAGSLARLSFIHFARWTLVRELPDNGQPTEELHFPHLYFESNFNGGWAEYIDAFSHILTTGMKIFWSTSYGFPQPLPTGPFKLYIQHNEVVASHFHSAYPQATTTMILSALELEQRLARFDEDVAALGDEEFAQRWRELLTDVQGLI